MQVLLLVAALVLVPWYHSLAALALSTELSLHNESPESLALLTDVVQNLVHLDIGGKWLEARSTLLEL